MRTSHTEITSQAEMGTPRLTPGSWYATHFVGSGIKRGCGFPRAYATGLLYTTPSYIAGKGSMISLEASEEVVRL